jgi:hypothetical protein
MKTYRITANEQRDMDKFNEWAGTDFKSGDLVSAGVVNLVGEYNFHVVYGMIINVEGIQDGQD